MIRYYLISLLAFSTVSPLMAQKAPKVDSLLVTVSRDRQETLDAVVEAFQASGLQVTNTTSSMVEADLGKRAGTFSVFERKVRALILGSVNNATRVLIIGDETSYSSGSNPFSYRIDSKAKAEGGRIWHSMTVVASRLESLGGTATSPPGTHATTESRQQASGVTPPPASTPPAPPVSARRTGNVPPGTNWVADSRTKLYYAVGCPATSSIAEANRFFYRTEASLQSSGLTRAKDCELVGDAEQVNRLP